MTCGAMMKSMQHPGHTHVCNGTHDAGDHKCADPECGRWFWENPKRRAIPPKKKK